MVNARCVGGTNGASGLNHHMGGFRPNRRSSGNASGVNHRRGERLRAILRRQHSIVTRPQLLDLGFTGRQIERRIEAGRLIPLYRGVYLVGPIAPPLADEMAAVLACGDRAYLSHHPAAHIWSLIPYSPKPEIAEVTVIGREPHPRGIRVHTVRALAPAETTTHKDVPVTTPARTLLDLAPTLNSRQLERSLAEASRRRLVRRAQLDALLARHPGRPGTPALRHLLETEPAFTRSELEELFLALVRDAGLPQPEANAELGPYEIDFLWREQRLAVELDSWGFHGDRKAFEDDRRRDAELVARGFRVIRVTWRELEDNAFAVVARIAAALAVGRR